MRDPKGIGGGGWLACFRLRDSRVRGIEEAGTRKIKREEIPFFFLYSRAASLFAPLSRYLRAWKRLGGFFLVRYNN